MIFGSQKENMPMMNTVINQEKMDILDYFTIPATTSLARCEAITHDEIRLY